MNGGAAWSVAGTFGGGMDSIEVSPGERILATTLKEKKKVTGL